MRLPGRRTDACHADLISGEKGQTTDAAAARVRPPMTAVTSARIQLAAKVACAYGGMAWGLFWLPLRELDALGIGGAMATAVFYIVPLIFVAPLFLFRARQLAATDMALHLTALMVAVSMTLYALSFLFTDVVRAMLLYYMTPVWSALLARAWLKEPITMARWVSFVLGTLGMLVIFGADAGVPLPSNSGDWISLASGIVWAIAVVMMRRGFRGEPMDLTLVYFLYGAIFACALTFIPGAAGDGLPVLDDVWPKMAWLIPVIVILVVPTVYSVMWGSPKLNPGTVGILFMTEISVGAITAWLWAGEPFGARELTGVILITAAGLTETVADVVGGLRQRFSGRARSLKMALFDPDSER